MAIGSEIDSVSGHRSGNQLTNETHIGMLGDFCGGFENSLKSQANGAIQIANRLGANIDETKLAPVDNASFGSKEWAAQIAGEAAALTVELFAARKLGASIQAARHEGDIALAAKVTETGTTKIASSIGLGAVLGGVLTPTNDSANFWSDRLRNTMSGAVTFGAMGGVSVGLEAAGKVGSGALSALLRNGYVNNAVGGFVGGTVGDMTKSALAGDMPTMSKEYWQHVAQSGVEFSLVGVGSHTMGRAVSGVSSLGEQRPGTDRTNARYYADSIGLTRNPDTFNKQADFKVISGKSELDRMQSELSTGAASTQADVIVKQQIHGVLGDFLGGKYRAYGDPKLILLSHGNSITPELAAKYDLIGTCSPLDAALRPKDIFQNRTTAENSDVWLNNRTDSTFSLTRNRTESIQSPIDFEPVKLGPVGRVAVEVNQQPIRPGDLTKINDHLEVTRMQDGRLFARDKSLTTGVWEKAKGGENIVVATDALVYYGSRPVHAGTLYSAQFMRNGSESTDLSGHTVGKDANGHIFVRDNNSSDGIFVRTAPPNQWVELKTDDKFVHLGPNGRVEIRTAPVPELTAKDSVRVNGKLLSSGNELTIGRSGDRDVNFSESDLSVSRVHGTVNRDASGQIYFTDASSFGSYLKVPQQIKVPLNPTDSVGILSPKGSLEMHQVINLAIKANSEMPLQTTQGTLKTEPVVIGRTADGLLYLQDNSAAGAAYLKLRKLEPTPIQANDELILGTQGTSLKLEVSPTPRVISPIAKPIVPPVAPPVAVPQIAKPVQPPQIAKPIQPPVQPPVVPPQIAKPVQPPFVPPQIAKPVQPPFVPPQIGTPVNTPVQRVYRVSPLTNDRFAFKVREPFVSTDPKAILEHNEKLDRAAARPIHHGQWADVTAPGDMVTKGSRNYLVFDNINDARRAASFIEGIINRKTRETSDVGYSAKLIGNKYTPTLSWNGLEGMVDIDPISKLPRAIYGVHGWRPIPT